MSQIDPLDDELESLLAPAREIPPTPDAVGARVLEQIEHAVELSAPRTDGASTVGGTGATAGAGASVTGKLWAVGAIAFVAGALIGGVVGASVSSGLLQEEGSLGSNGQRRATATDGSGNGTRATQAPVSPERPASPDAPVQVRGTADMDLAEQGRDVTPPSGQASGNTRVDSNRSTASPSPRRGQAPADSLAAERRIIDAARGAVMRGHHQDALTALDRHLSRFPDGQLSEERASLRVRALLELGRSEEARSAAQQFRTNYPNSLFWPALEHALDP